MKRVLVTGSRDWANPRTIMVALQAIRDELGDFVLVSGACPTGADRMAENAHRGSGLPVELHPARWNELGKKAGFVRNAEMVDLGADLCLAFIRNNSKGATHTADLAERAGIPTTRYTEDTE